MGWPAHVTKRAKMVNALDAVVWKAPHAVPITTWRHAMPTAPGRPSDALKAAVPPKEARHSACVTTAYRANARKGALFSLLTVSTVSNNPNNAWETAPSMRVVRHAVHCGSGQYLASPRDG